jgi:hypothetical protein
MMLEVTEQKPGRANRREERKDEDHLAMGVERLSSVRRRS